MCFQMESLLWDPHKLLLCMLKMFLITSTHDYLPQCRHITTVLCDFCLFFTSSVQRGSNTAHGCERYGCIRPFIFFGHSCVIVNRSFGQKISNITFGCVARRLNKWCSCHGNFSKSLLINIIFPWCQFFDYIRICQTTTIITLIIESHLNICISFAATIPFFMCASK